MGNNCRRESSSKARDVEDDWEDWDEIIKKVKEYRLLKQHLAHQFMKASGKRLSKEQHRLLKQHLALQFIKAGRKRLSMEQILARFNLLKVKEYQLGMKQNLAQQFMKGGGKRLSMEQNLARFKKRRWKPALPSIPEENSDQAGFNQLRADSFSLVSCSLSECLEENCSRLESASLV